MNDKGRIVELTLTIGLMVIAMHCLLGAPAEGTSTLPHAEITRWFAIGGNETLVLNCLPEENPAHFYCRVERQINAEMVASVVIDEKTARAATDHFFKLWPMGLGSAGRGPNPQGRLSLSWSVADGQQKASGEAVWRDKRQEDRTTAVLSLEGSLEAQLSR